MNTDKKPKINKRTLNCDLFSGKYKMRVVKPKKGKGSFKRDKRVDKTLFYCLLNLLKPYL